MSKEWAWSYSKKKNYDTCPKRHYEVDIQKNFTEESEQLTWGNEVHKALAAAVLYAKGIPHAGTGRDRIAGAPLPETMKQYQRWVDLIGSTPGETLIEQKYAITRDFRATTYFAQDVWYRGICDLLHVSGTGNTKVATALDWKTGKVKHDSIQLMLMASCILIHRPDIHTVKTRFVWLQEDCTTPDVWDRAKVMREWAGILPQVNEMEQAYKTLTFPPKPGKLCRAWCPVTSCPFHGKTP